MKNFEKTQIKQVNGTPYEQGYFVGSFFMQALNEEVETKNIKNNKQVMELLNKYIEQTNNLCPSVIEEIKGRSDGAKIDFYDYLFYICYELKNINSPHENCTTIMVNNKNEFFIAHNEDGFYVPHNICPMRYETNKFFIIAQTENIPSSTVLQSDYGFTYSTNFIALDKKYYDYHFLPRNLFYGILAHSKSSNEAINIIKTIPIISGASINFVDETNRKMFNIEKFKDKVSIKEINGINIHSNIFNHDEFTKYNPDRNNKTLCFTSFTRQDISISLANNLGGEYSQKNILDILKFYQTTDYDSVLQKSIDSHILTYGTYIRDFNKNTSTLYKWLGKEEVINI